MKLFVPVRPLKRNESMKTQDFRSILFPYAAAGVCDDLVPQNASDSDDLVPENAGDSDFMSKINKDCHIDFGGVILEKVIFEGPHSIVYAAKYNSNGVALKLFRPSINQKENMDHKEKFQKEVLLLARLNHENIVKFIGMAVEPTMMVATELMRGDTLQRYLWSMYPESLDLRSSLKFALDISKGMRYLHSNRIIFHGLNPANLLLSSDKKNIKLANFALAREETLDVGTSCEDGACQQKTLELSLNCKNLNTKAAKEHYGYKTDVYSFLVVLLELLTTKVKNDGMPSLEKLPKDVASLLEKCTCEDLSKLPSFEEITDSLSNCLESLCSTESRAETQRSFILFGKEIIVPEAVEMPLPTIMVTVDKDPKSDFEVGLRFLPTNEEIFGYLKEKIKNPNYTHPLICDADVKSKKPEELGWDMNLNRLFPGNERFFYTKREAMSKGGVGKNFKRTIQEAGTGAVVGSWRISGSKNVFDRRHKMLGTVKYFSFEKAIREQDGSLGGDKTGWVMHEFEIHGGDLADSVLCRIRFRGNEFPIAQQ